MFERVGILTGWVWNVLLDFVNYAHIFEYLPAVLYLFLYRVGSDFRSIVISLGNCLRHSGRNQHHIRTREGGPRRDSNRRYSAI